MEKPTCRLAGGGNVFALIARASDALRRAGQPEQAKKMATECFAAKDYAEVLVILEDYVEVL